MLEGTTSEYNRIFILSGTHEKALHLVLLQVMFRSFTAYRSFGEMVSVSVLAPELPRVEYVTACQFCTGSIPTFVSVVPYQPETPIIGERHRMCVHFPNDE